VYTEINLWNKSISVFHKKIYFLEKKNIPKTYCQHKLHGARRYQGLSNFFIQRFFNIYNFNRNGTYPRMITADLTEVEFKL
jgi:hypothetical protein